MELLTEVRIEQPGFGIGYEDPMLMLGSCFVENIGARLEYYHFPVLTNPCGIVYNPMSVADTLDILLSGRKFGCEDLLQNGDRWVSLSHHGRFSDRDPEVCLRRINGELERGRKQLERCSVLVVTWGTSWIYRHRASGRIAANCHKFPAADFERRRLDVDEITGLYAGLLARLRQVRPDLKVIFTVSPIRHWKDGAHGNQLSKAVLLLSIDRLVSEFPFVYYFPSYEIVMDELRDYRFYAPDMLHLSDQGIGYIWEKFQQTFLSGDTCEIMKKVDRLERQLQHRPFDAGSEAYQAFVRNARMELDALLDRIGTGRQERLTD